MKTLEDAWRWYEAVRSQSKLSQRLAEKHWERLPWDGPLGRDVRLREIQSAQLVEDSLSILGELDDLAVLLMFSVFEATVRNRVLEDIKPEVDRLRHPSLRLAAGDVVEWIEQGSFNRVLEPFKSGGKAALIEEVNQVRRYRNWVAHGRRGVQPPSVDPNIAFERLSRFLDLLAGESPP